MCADEGGVFKARTTRQETKGADEVHDSYDTSVDLPIDMRHAEQVEV